MKEYFWFILRFVSDPDFQEKQEWVKWITKKASIISPNTWTLSRVPGVIIVIAFKFVNPYLELVAYIFFCLTDWFDGKVARHLGISTKKGAVLDGLIDRMYILPILAYWGSVFIGYTEFVILFLVEFPAYLILYIVRKSRGDENKDIYEHTKLSKIKFGNQIALGFVLWIAINLFPNWKWWPLWIGLWTNIIIGLCILSVAYKISKNTIRFWADSITVGNVICGIVAIYFADKDITMSSALIIIAAVLDILDGLAARTISLKYGLSSSKWGSLKDSMADFVSFGIAPAWLVYINGIGAPIAIGYALATLTRLVHYMIGKKNACGERSDIFCGLPCPAAAVMLCSVFVFKNQVPICWFNAIIIVCTVLQISFMFFDLKWYHFKNYIRLPKPLVIMPPAAFTVSVSMGKTWEGIATLSIMYLILFFKPVANIIWHWERK